MYSCELAAKAKINISLDITGKRDDGYHLMEMIMQSVELCDVVRLEKSDKIELHSNLYYLPIDERNTAYKIARCFFEATGIKAGVRIDIFKRIPLSAGLAGGSSDAAAVIKGLNSLYETRLTTDEMCRLSEAVGCDIPYCIRGGTMLATGVGEILTPLPSLPGCSIVICKPRFGISTKETFTSYDSKPSEKHPDTKGIIKALEERDLNKIASRMYNVLENVHEDKQNQINRIKQQMITSGALGAIMSGSGPSVFGIFKTREKARECYKKLSKRYKECFIASAGK